MATEDHQAPRAEARRTITTAACQGCRTRKTKCNGGRPCSSCTRRSIACEYETEPHESRHGALKRKCAALEQEADEKKRLIHLLTSSSEEDALRVLHCVRSGQDLSSILDTDFMPGTVPYSHIADAGSAWVSSPDGSVLSLGTTASTEVSSSTSSQGFLEHFDGRGSGDDPGLPSPESSVEMRLSYICNPPGS